MTRTSTLSADLSRKVAAAALLALMIAPASFAQSSLPRTTEGRPDLQGNWSSQWLTPVERPAGVTKLVLDDAEAAQLVKTLLARAEQNNPLDPELAWPDATSLTVVRGENRSSLVIDPPDGKLPWTDAGRAAARGYITGLDHPEQRMTTERCIGGVGWAPLQIRSASMIHRIVQTSDYFVLQTEAYDDTRIAGFGRTHNPISLDQPGGDSVARWDGDVLEVVTINNDPQFSTHGIVTVKSPAARVTERFELVSPDEVVYTYTINDPAYYAKPWTAQYSLVRTTDKLFEFACHEGNYSMIGMLGGARVDDAKAAKK